MSDVTDGKKDMALGVECALPAGFEARGAGTKNACAPGGKWWRRIAWCVLVGSCLALGFWQLEDEAVAGG
jgi:hypothetical protein